MTRHLPDQKIALSLTTGSKMGDRKGSTQNLPQKAHLVVGGLSVPTGLELTLSPELVGGRPPEPSPVSGYDDSRGTGSMAKTNSFSDTKQTETPNEKQILSHRQ